MWSEPGSMKSRNDEDDADANKCGDKNDNNNEGDSDGNIWQRPI